jgi:hypothetical protein
MKSPILRLSGGLYFDITKIERVNVDHRGIDVKCAGGAEYRFEGEDATALANFLVNESEDCRVKAPTPKPVTKG